jgi:putative transcriptional regulator
MMKMSRVFDIQNIKDMVDDMENSIRHRRKELGLSQEELAKKCGVSRQTVNAIENDKYDPTLALAFNLARELKTTVDELFKP